jgi:hypothetical protein
MVTRRASFGRSFGKSASGGLRDEYLNATGRNHFVPVEFLEWLKPRPDHRAWPIFFGTTDEEAALQHRLSIVRSFVNGLRIRVTIPQEVESASQVVVRIPAFISPVSRRTEGGGYIPVDVQDEPTLAELCRQASTDLARWIERHEGVARIAGVDVASINEIAGALAARGVEGEAA